MKLNSLEAYLLNLGKLAVMLQLLQEEQATVRNSGILNIDETELSETIDWNCKKVLTSLSDQVRLVGERTEKTWEETIEELKEVLIGDDKTNPEGNEGRTESVQGKE